MKHLIFLFILISFTNISFSDQKEILVNEIIINKNLINFIKNEVKNEGIQLTEEMEENIVKRLIDLELIHQQAKKEGLTSMSKFLSKSELAFKELVYTTYLQNFIKKNKISKNDINNEYKNFRDNYNKINYKASHILVKSKNEAKLIIKELKNGLDFKELAKKHSIDEESNGNGGDLGWFNEEDMVESFSKAIKKLVVGELTDYPVQSQFGWHIIQLNQVKPRTAPSLEEKEEEIRLLLQKEKLKSHLNNLRLTADIKQ